MKLRTCVSPEGRFVCGVHRPQFTADNYRSSDAVEPLGEMPDGNAHTNKANLPPGDVHEPQGTWIYEVPNALPFRGTTYIGKAWADARANDPEAIALPKAPAVSFSSGQPDQRSAISAIHQLPRPLQLALAVSSTDPRDLCCLAHLAGTFCMDTQGNRPQGLAFARQPDGRIKARITDAALFDAVANNRHLPDDYKVAMVLRPGVQGGSEIMGEWPNTGSHVFEYLRRNSYIPWGHYAANMADSDVRYRVRDLSLQDMTGMRHLYYQRTYIRLANLLNLPRVADRRPLTGSEMETLRQRIVTKLKEKKKIGFNRALWGWNYGFDYAPSGYRLHASHQQIHQQFALIPATVPAVAGDGALPAYACGDLVGDFVREFRKTTGKPFFDCYQAAIEKNRRMDGVADRFQHLVVFEDHRVMVFVPKAQTSQWELQLMPKTSMGNVVEADAGMRRSLDRALWIAVQALDAMGARMITTIEYSKPFVNGDDDQRLLMALLPKLPESPGAFSEAQLRWINGHYPEDFALACRRHVTETQSNA